MQWEELKHALRHAAETRSTALTLDKKRRRVMRELFLREEGAVATREAKAGTHPAYVQAEDAWLEAETSANLAQAEVDVLRIRFDAWRSEQAMERAKLEKGIFGSGS